MPSGTSRHSEEQDRIEFFLLHGVTFKYHDEGNVHTALMKLPGMFAPPALV